MNVSQTRWKYLQKNVADLQKKVLTLHKIKLFNSRMKTIFRTYQFELQPTQEQKVLLDKHFGCIRYVYRLPFL